MAVRVLLIEDDQLIQRMYEKIFTFEKFVVEMASDGEEGLAKVRSMNPKPTVILLDVMMPKMNGMQVLEQLKLDQSLKTIPVIMLSNLAGENDVESALSKGAIKYIIKSEYDPKQIADMVNEIVAGYTRDDVPAAA
jgi:CheY-like chemotaxis protein